MIRVASSNSQNKVQERETLRVLGAKAVRAVVRGGVGCVLTADGNLLICEVSANRDNAPELVWRVARPRWTENLGNSADK